MKSGNSHPRITLDQFPEAVELLLSEINELKALITEKQAVGNDHQERPITTKQLCEHLGITEPTVIRWKKKGKIPYMRIGASVRFNLKDVLKALEKK